MYFAIYWIVFLVVFVGTLLIILAVQQSNANSNRNKQQDINIKAKEYLSNSKFNASKIFYLNDNNTHDQSNSYKKFIAVDNDNSKLCLVDYEKGNMLIVGFEEILNYKIYENGSNSTSGGNIGGLWGGIFAAETNGMYKDLKLIIRLKRYDTSQISYEIISNTAFNMGINKSTKPYKKCMSTLQEIVSFLEVLKSENSKNQAEK